MRCCEKVLQLQTFACPADSCDQCGVICGWPEKGMLHCTMQRTEEIRYQTLDFLSGISGFRHSGKIVTEVLLY